MSDYARTLLLGALLVGLGGCVSTAPQGGGGGTAAKPVTVDHPEALAGKDQVAIGGFKVSFITFDKSSAKSESPMWSSNTGYAKAVVRARLGGVGDDTFQAITDAAYADFKAALAANGYQVVERGAIEAHPAYAKIKVERSPQKTVSSMTAITGGSREDATFAPTGLPLIPSTGRLWPYELATIAKEKGIPVVNAHYTVHFAYFGQETGYDANTWNRLKGAEYSAKVTAGQGVQVLSGSRVDVLAGYEGTFQHPNAGLALTRSINDFSPFGSTRDATSGAQKFANTFSAVMGAFSGGSQTAKELEMTAEGDAYAGAATRVLKKANAALVAEMAAAR